MIRSTLVVPAAALLASLTLFSCSDDETPTSPVDASFEWVSIPFLQGDIVNIAVFRPDGPIRGTVLAFPWGSGVSELSLSLVDSYWDEAALDAGYAVVVLEAFGPGLETLGDLVMPNILEYIDLNLGQAAGERVIFTGASNGGIGVFYAALSVPDRVDAIIAMPGRYTGDVGALSVLAGVPVRMMVGELDTSWVGFSESTLETLEAAGLAPTLEILPGQDHVLIVDQQDLVDWIETH